MNILDRFSTQATFTPASLDDYFALQLARRLNDSSNVSCYVQLCGRFGKDHLLSVYRTEIAAGELDLAARFRSHFH